MSGTGFITVKKFAELTRTTRDILHNFDKIGLLSPMRGENNYRYYSVRQLSMLSVIRTLQGLGMSLAEIKELKDQRTPERAEEIFSLQIEKIDKKIDDWSRAKRLLMTFENSIHASLNIDEKAITVRNLPAEAIVLGDLNDYSEDMNDCDALFSFYKAIGNRYPNMDLNYPIWAIFSKERIKRRDWVWPDLVLFL